MRLLILAVLLFNSLHADEVERIESIVQEIQKLRSDYSKLDDELTLSLYNLKDEKEKNRILKDEINSLNNQIKILNKNKKSNISSDDNIDSLSDKVSKYKIKLDNCLKSKRASSENSFPQLQMKEQYKVESDNRITYFKASAFRLKTQSNIYDGIDGNIVGRWEETTSFTSNQKAEKWVKITGYFVDKVWRPSQRELWIHERDTIRRGD